MTDPWHVRHFSYFLKFLCLLRSRVAKWTALVYPVCSFSMASYFGHTPHIFPTCILFLGIYFLQYIKRPMKTCPRWCCSLLWSLTTLCSYLKEQTKRHMLLVCNPAGSDLSYSFVFAILPFLVSTVFVLFSYFTLFPFLLSYLGTIIIKSLHSLWLDYTFYIILASPT